MKISKSALVTSALLLLAASVVAQESKPGFTVTHPKAPKATETDTYGINNSGVIAGDYVDAAGLQHGMTLKGATLVTFDHPGCSTAPGTGTAGYGINTAGLVAGWCASSTTLNDIGFVWSPATKKFVDLKVPGAVSTQATGINDKGQIAGLYFDAKGAEHGFFYDGKKYTQLDVAGAVATAAWDVNNSGMVTVYTLVAPAGASMDSYLYNSTTKKYVKIDVPGATTTTVHAINSKGDMDYTVFDASNNRHGVLYVAMTKMFYTFDDPAGKNATRADGLNDTLVLVGRSSPAAGNSVGFQAVFHP